MDSVLTHHQKLRARRYKPTGVGLPLLVLSLLLSLLLLLIDNRLDRSAPLFSAFTGLLDLVGIDSWKQYG